VIDAHPLLWWIAGDKKLGHTARSFLDGVDNGESVLIIPAVVLAELFMIAEKGRTALTTTVLKAHVKRWHKADNIRLSKLTPQIVIESVSLTIVPEIFDRLIVAEAKKLNYPLITKDPEIIASGLVTVVW